MPLPPNASITDVINKLTELEGINQKSELASVIGSPALSTDTVAQQIVKLQNSKNTLAINLTDKGVDAVGSESLQDLVSKVEDIDTGGMTIGTATATGLTMNFELYGSESVINTWYVTVSGLSFKPRKIVLVRSVTNNHYFTEYDSELFGLTEYCRTFVTGNTFRNGDVYSFKGNKGNAYVNSTGFRLPVGETGQYNWYIYK